MMKAAKREVREMKTAIIYIEGDQKEVLQKKIDEKEEEVSNLEADRLSMSKTLEKLKKDKASFGATYPLSKLN